MTTKRATFERDDEGYWFVDFPDVPGCHTQGRSLATARRRAVDALQGFLEDDAAEVEEEFVLPSDVRTMVDEVQQARAGAERAADQARANLQAATVALLEHGLPMREVAALLGVSHQRIGQVAQHARPARAKNQPTERARERA